MSNCNNRHNSPWSDRRRNLAGSGCSPIASSCQLPQDCCDNGHHTQLQAQDQIQNQRQGSLGQAQGSEAQGQFQSPLTQGQGDEVQGQFQSPLAQAQGSEAQGQFQSPLAQAQGSEAQGQFQSPLTQGQGDEVQGQFQSPLAQAQGSEAQGQFQSPLAQAQGSEAQGQFQSPLTQGQGDEVQGQFQSPLAQAQGSEAQGQFQSPLAQAQGNESQTQYQSPLNQGQGNESQTQSQGAQYQTQTGHGGQDIGEQTVTNTPSITAPVTVSGVNVNVTVSRDYDDDDDESCEDCCLKGLSQLLATLNILKLAIADPANAQILFYVYGLTGTPVTANLTSVNPDCTFGILDGSSNTITVAMKMLDALELDRPQATPNLFDAIINYINTQVCVSDLDDDCNSCNNYIGTQLNSYIGGTTQLRVTVLGKVFTGFVYKVCNCVAYLVDDATTPTKLYSIPICKIISYQTAQL